MARRRVKQSRKNKDGDITALCNKGEFWSPRKKKDAVSDINSGRHSYYVNVQGVGAVDIHVVDHPKHGDYLRTDPDKTDRNNLDDLPNC